MEGKYQHLQFDMFELYLLTTTYTTHQTFPDMSRVKQMNNKTKSH